jgi:hypothetical protein
MKRELSKASIKKQNIRKIYTKTKIKLYPFLIMQCKIIKHKL